MEEQEDNVADEEFDVIVEQGKDPEISLIKQKLNSKNADRNTYSHYMLMDGKVYFISEKDEDVRLRLYVPAQLWGTVIKQYHDELGHMGIDKVYSNMRLKYYWPNMYKYTYRYVGNCATCKMRNLATQRAPLQDTDVPPYPFAKISIDISGPYPKTLSGNLYIVHFIDHYSLWPESFAVPDKTSQTVAQLLIEEIIPRFGTPLEIVTDNGPENIGFPLQETLRELNIHHVTTTFYRPQSNGKNERMHRTLHDILSKKVSDEPSTWDLHLNSTLAALRMNVGESNQFSPFYLLYTREPVLPLDNLLQPRQKYAGEDLHRIRLQEQHKAFLSVHKNLRKAKRKQKKYADRKAKPVSLAVGDQVYFLNHNKKSKLDSRWRPNYVVIDQTSPVTFLVKHQLTNVTTKAHASQLRTASEDWDGQVSPGTRELPKRKSTLVVADSESDTVSGSEDENETDVSVLGQLVHQHRQEREDSSSEEDIPLMELRNRLRAKRERLRQEESVTADPVSPSPVSTSECPSVSEHNDMEIDAVAVAPVRDQASDMIEGNPNQKVQEEKCNGVLTKSTQGSGPENDQNHKIKALLNAVANFF